MATRTENARIAGLRQFEFGDPTPNAVGRQALVSHDGCVVHLDGKAVKSCTTLAVMADGHEVKTIEGLAADGAPLHPMQEAFREHHGLQCGFCTPGMIMTAVDLVNRKGHDLSDHVIREELEGNLCRCTGYQNIVQSIAAGAKAMAKSA